ncbi:MAG: hypothetical protein RL308_2579 [Bacteroidota bacterium]|jgi:hypothetical protein
MHLKQIKNSIFVLNMKNMKRLIGLLACIMLFNSCDDGDIKLDTFNFDPAAAINDCDVNNGLFFKVKNNEALLLKTPISTFENVVTAANTPRTLLISSTNQVVYRLFDSIISNAYFCSTFPPASPMVLDEWNAAYGVTGTSGLIEVTTTAVLDPTTQAVTGYNHYVVFKNITFSNGTNSFTYASYIFGNFVTTI